MHPPNLAAGSAGSALESLALLPQGPAVKPPTDAWLPAEPQTLAQTGLADLQLEALILKLLLATGSETGRKIAEHIRLSFGLVAEVLRSLKAQLLVNYKSQAAMGDFEYELSDTGREKARWHSDLCTYCGAAPVPLAEYIASVERQSIRKVRPKLADLCHAFADLTLPPATISQIGQAVHAGRGLFLYGQPGNGKTSIAERIIRAISQHIWIPRTIAISGEIMRLFDPANHEEVPLVGEAGKWLDTLHFDRRWVRIRRPSVVVGGELKLEQLEVANNAATGILESPVQLKSNCGALVVDDFGRQRCSTSELLNRWIVPLEKGHDFLNLPSGRQIQVPFDQLLVFSTNLEPHKLVDEAFLRRIPYKIEVTDPTAREFRDLSKTWCGKLGIEYHEEAVEQLLAKHFGDGKRPLRYCHPRDLLLQVRSFCEFHELPLVLSAKALDVAVKNYFSSL